MCVGADVVAAVARALANLTFDLKMAALAVREGALPHLVAMLWSPSTQLQQEGQRVQSHSLPCVRTAPRTPAWWLRGLGPLSRPPERGSSMDARRGLSASPQRAPKGGESSLSDEQEATSAVLNISAAGGSRGAAWLERSFREDKDAKDAAAAPAAAEGAASSERAGAAGMDTPLAALRSEQSPSDAAAGEAAFAFSAAASSSAAAERSSADTDEGPLASRRVCKCRLPSSRTPPPRPAWRLTKAPLAPT